ncbi:SDR family NAD(P)-dependent oxidoreductase [Ferrovibrio sp. MS7]|jgi:NAD(P)-dependent dehydrogenase (short-subunit alcohol dehydrogenase family)|uniref:SDR family NAD(P)-dependent oxidoreductase n=1 Tax=Ferrovibrio plantarum TaxID=3119164 RepID=UPI001B5B3078|nr:SDR family NAD(P)-dependent oxidoreductase [Ferrovibrio sp.]
MDLKGVGAIVTGGASGLGAATARELAKAGAKVAIFDMNLELAQQTAKEIGGVAIKCDVADGPGGEAAVKEAAEKVGPLRVLVNCAGVGTPMKAVGKDGPVALEKFIRVVQINLVGTFNMIRLVAHHMQQQAEMDGKERGCIINTASVAAFDGQIGQPAYGASKAGVHGMTLPLAREFASFGIRVCTIAPGLFGTPMMFALPPEAQESLGKSVPYPSRLGRPEEYAALARHICENQMLNGETIRLDGAIRMAPK